MRPMKPYTRAAKVAAVDGEVVMLGQGRMGGSMTPAAARKTGKRLLSAAKVASERRTGQVGDCDPGQTATKPKP